jgi:hypothetical protein
MAPSAQKQLRYLDTQLRGFGFINDLDRAILQAIAYGDIFDYPLTIEEIHRYLVGLPASPETIYQALQSKRLIPKYLACHGGYYYLPGREDLIQLRRERSQWAEMKWSQAIFYAAIMAKSPFVRMIGVTGALSLDNVDQRADLDYLIVAETGRLWMCRAFLLVVIHRAKRSGIIICPNYFITDRVLEFRERNLYTAHELAQMVPLYGMGFYTRMRAANSWLYDYLPNAAGPPIRYHLLPHPSTPLDPPLKSISEAALRLSPGSWLEKWEMNRKIRKLNAKRDGSIEAIFDADFCKGHFHNHATETIQKYEKRIPELGLYIGK